jgi:hypothetical protein
LNKAVVDPLNSYRTNVNIGNPAIEECGMQKDYAQGLLPPCEYDP